VVKLGGLRAADKGDVVRLVRAAEKRRSDAVRRLGGFGQRKVEELGKELDDLIDVRPMQIAVIKAVGSSIIPTTRNASGRSTRSARRSSTISGN